MTGEPRGSQPAEMKVTPAERSREVREVLFVDPDPLAQRAVIQALRSVAEVQVCSDFRDARSRLLSKPPDLLVTNIRLEAHNGLHLVHVAPSQTRCLVYAADQDLALAGEVQAAGAFFERAPRLTRALASYVTARLPRRDQRDPGIIDRRNSFRGGRRSTDLPA
jgi:DNA-binding NtrC family response regulator